LLRALSGDSRNVFADGELEKNSVVANFATTASDGKEYRVDYYNLDVIISVGYRVKSQRGVEFRKWANSVLRQYIMQGYAANQKRLADLGNVIKLLKRTEASLDAKQVLTVVEKYNTALDLLDSYDHQNMTRPKGTVFWTETRGLQQQCFCIFWTRTECCLIRERNWSMIIPLLLLRS